MYRLHIGVDEVLQIFLFAGAWLWFGVLRLDPRREVRQRALAGQDSLSFRTVPGGVALLDVTGEGTVLDHLRGDQQTTRTDIHAADMAVQQVVRIQRLPPDLGVEVEAAGREAAALRDVVHRIGDFRDVVR